MRILFVHHNPDPYGSSRSLFRLASRLVDEGHVATVVVPEEGPLNEWCRDAGVRVVLEPRLVPFERRSFLSPFGVIRFLAHLLPAVRQMKRHIRAFNPDIVHTNTSVLLAPALSARRLRIPHVWHLREFYGEFPVFWWIYARFMLRLSSRVVCISRAVADQFDGRRPLTKVRMLHNGYPRDEYEGVTEGRVKAFRRRYGLKPGHVLVGVIGRIKIRRKGQEVFIDAAARMASDHPDARFLVIGSPFRDYETQLGVLKDQARASGIADRLVFTGDVDDVGAAYQALDIVVVPSVLPEPFGGVIAEAMAFSKPVVATTAGAPPEIVVDGVTGLLVPPGDDHALSEALQALVVDPERRREMGAAGRSRYLSCFEFERFYGQLLDLYRDVAH